MWTGGFLIKSMGGPCSELWPPMGGFSPSLKDVRAWAHLASMD